ncbi:hypothetical protein ACFL34_02100 [Candidatus Sumerlaeota bacterium]
MPFTLFHERFKEIGIQETRSITIPPGGSFGLPAGDYGFFEMFCDEAGCDCRRVMFYVVSSARSELEATVSWGWEPAEFYAQWSIDDDPDIGFEIKGPLVDPLGPQTALGPAICDLVRDVLLRDQAYVERIKRHYAMFRQKIDGKPKRKRVRRKVRRKRRRK